MHSLSCLLTFDVSFVVQLLHHIRTVNFTNQFDEMVYFDSRGEPVPLYDIINWQRGRENVMRCATSLRPVWRSLTALVFLYFKRCIFASRFVKVGSYDGSGPFGQYLLIDRNSIVWADRQSEVNVCPSVGAVCEAVKVFLKVFFKSI